MADEEFEQYAVGWEAIADANSDPADDASWVPVRSQQSDREVAVRMVWQLREVHRNNPAVRRIELYGRPLPPDWELLDVGPEPLPDPPAAPVVEDQAPVEGQEVIDQAPADDEPATVTGGGLVSVPPAPEAEPTSEPANSSPPADQG